jgi:hypothetical protein
VARVAQGTDSTKEKHQQDSPAATHDQRKKNRQDRATGVGFMGLSDSDDIQNNSPDSSDKTSTERNDNQR